jgi:energy-converting hydrogenase A subunit R
VNTRRIQQKKLFISDCEGPISKNDNAYELTEHFIPDGDSFFAVVSKYDDVQTDIVKRPGYKAGDTLRLILPFLKAYGATNEKIRNFSAEHILLVPGARDTLRFVSNLMPSLIVSTSYEQYIHALCSVVDFPRENVYCTKLEIDQYRVDKEEVVRLRRLREEITAMPMIEIPDGAVSLDNFSARDQKTIRRLDEIFWEEIAEMESGKMLEDVNPVGGFEKARAVEDIVKKTGSSFRDVMYVGDSITDVEPFRFVREKGGLTVSFNGNRYAVREAEVAVLSSNTIVTSILADAFGRLGKKRVVKLVEEWSYSALKRYGIALALQKRIIESYPQTLPQVEIITLNNKERLMKESSTFRKTVRGEAIGRLG